MSRSLTKVRSDAGFLLMILTDIPLYVILKKRKVSKYAKKTKKEQKKNNPKCQRGTAVLRCNSKGVIAFYGARGSDGEALQAHELLAHR